MKLSTLNDKIKKIRESGRDLEICISSYDCKWLNEYNIYFQADFSSIDIYQCGSCSPGSILLTGKKSRIQFDSIESVKFREICKDVYELSFPVKKFVDGSEEPIVLLVKAI